MSSKTNWKIKLGNFFFKYRAISPLPFIVILFLCFRPGSFGARDTIIHLAGLAVVLVGIILRALAVGYARTGTSGRENFLRAENLNTDGVYSVVRNPLYVGNFIIYNGLVITYANPWALLLFNLYLVGLYTFIILAEEDYLKRTYGGAYKEYMAGTPRVIPNFRLYRAPSVPFSFRKMIFKEKNTMFYSLTFYLVFLIYKEYLTHNGIIEKTSLLVYLALALFALNVILIILKKRFLKESAEKNS